MTCDNGQVGHDVTVQVLGGGSQGRHWIPPRAGQTFTGKVVSKREDLGWVWMGKAVLH